MTGCLLWLGPVRVHTNMHASVDDAGNFYGHFHGRGLRGVSASPAMERRWPDAPAISGEGPQ
jgi:hypothetical protein